MEYAMNEFELLLNDLNQYLKLSRELHGNVLNERVKLMLLISRMVAPCTRYG